MTALLVPAAAFVILAATILALSRRIVFHAPANDVSLEWLAEFSVDAYLPLERLFSRHDYSFLASQPGCTSGLCSKLRAERRAILSEYLRQISVDFSRLVALADLMLVYGERDRPDFAAAIWKQRILFYRSLFVMHARLALSSLGVPLGGPVPVIRALRQMRDSVASLTPPPLASSA